MYEGQTEAGLRCIGNIRERYDGCKRNPFDEAECGHHYARAMASWAAVLALTGFHYSAVDGRIEFVATKNASRFFWSNGYAWGTIEQEGDDREEQKVKLSVLHGTLQIKHILLKDFGEIELKPPVKIGIEQALEVNILR